MAETWGRSWPVDEMAEIQEVDPPPPQQDTGETLVAIQSWEGPLPAPETLERFEAVVPAHLDQPVTIIAEWQAETRHRPFESFWNMSASCLVSCSRSPPLLSQVMQRTLVPRGWQELLAAAQLQVWSGLWSEPSRQVHLVRLPFVKTPSQRGTDPENVIPAKAGIQAGWSHGASRTPGFVRGNDSIGLSCPEVRVLTRPARAVGLATHLE